MHTILTNPLQFRFFNGAAGAIVFHTRYSSAATAQVISAQDISESATKFLVHVLCQCWKEGERMLRV